MSFSGSASLCGHLAGLDRGPHERAVLDQDARHMRKAAAAFSAAAEPVVEEVRRQHRIGILDEDLLDDGLQSRRVMMLQEQTIMGGRTLSST